jgi:hypothetical protein
VTTKGVRIIWILFGICSLVVFVLLTRTGSWQCRFFGNEVWVDVNSARIKRIDYRFFVPTTSSIETNLVAEIATRVFHADKSNYWVLAQRKCIVGRVYDEFPETRLLDSIAGLSALLRCSNMTDMEHRIIVSEFIKKLSSEDPKVVQDFVQKTESNYWSTKFP